MKTALLLLMGILVNAFAFAQSREARMAIRKGNRLYRAEKYDSAKMSYEQGLKNAPGSFDARFNLGDALYQKEDYGNARKAFNSGLQATDDKTLQSKAWHNIGNTFMKQKKWEEAADAFKNALKLNDKDSSSKYNLAYAQAMLKKQQNKKGNKSNKDNKNNKDDKNKKDQDKNKDENKNKDQQNKDQNKKGKDKKDQQNKDSEDKDKQDKEQKDKPQQGDKGKQEQEEPKHPQPMPSKLSRQEADNLLNALNQEEKQLHDKKKQEKGVPMKLDKDW